jgi:hypothetical protein
MNRELETRRIHIHHFSPASIPIRQRKAIGGVSFKETSAFCSDARSCWCVCGVEGATDDAAVKAEVGGDGIVWCWRPVLSARSARNSLLRALDEPTV